MAREYTRVDPDEKREVDKQALQASFLKLQTSAQRLNAGSDLLSATIAKLDECFKALNLGITVWETLSKSVKPDGKDRSVGYARVGKRWGLALRVESGTGPEREVETWLFQDAPRYLRLEAIARLPDLLDTMAVRAEEMLDQTRRAADRVHEMENAIKQLTNPTQE
jgi:hypothetical protein